MRIEEKKLKSWMIKVCRVNEIVTSNNCHTRFSYFFLRKDSLRIFRVIIYLYLRPS